MTPDLCRTCAEWAFARWRGWCSAGTETWQQKPNLPDVPLLDGGVCPRCQGSIGVRPEEITYHNFHGPSNTGLPDYYFLDLDPANRTFGEKWGRPYLDAWVSERIPLDLLEIPARKDPKRR